MTTQAMADVGTAEPKKVKGSPKWGDLLLRIVAGLVLLYLFLPIFVIVLFSFNNPKGKFNYSWQGFTLNNWAHPFKYRRVHPHFVLSLAEGRSINPITGGNWQGTGVVPDVDVPADRALETALTLVRKALAARSR